MFLCSIDVQNLQQVVYVFCKFCVLRCLVLFTFILNIFLANESMYIAMMIEKNPAILLKRDSKHLHSREFCRIFKNTLFTGDLRKTASDVQGKYGSIFKLSNNNNRFRGVR